LGPKAEEMLLQAINFKRSESQGVAQLLTAEEYRRNARICTYASIVWFASFIVLLFLLVASASTINDLVVRNLEAFYESVFLETLLFGILFLGLFHLVFKGSLMIVMKYLENRRVHCPNCGALPSGKERIEAVINSGACWNCRQPIVKV